MKREELKSILQKISIAYPDNFKVNQEMFDLWFECLKDLEHEKAGMAVISHIKNNKYPPRIADIREKYDEIVDERDKIIRGYYQDLLKYFTNTDGAYDVYTKIIIKQSESNKIRAAEKIYKYVLQHHTENTLMNLIKTALYENI